MTAGSLIEPKYVGRRKTRADPDTFLPQVGLYCWIHLGGRDDLLNGASTESLVFFHAEDPASRNKQRNQFVDQYVLADDGIGLDAFSLHFCHELQREAVRADEYEHILGVVATFSHCPAVMACLLKHGVDIPLGEMANRVVSSEWSYSERVNTWERAFKLHQYVAWQYPSVLCY